MIRFSFELILNIQTDLLKSLPSLTNSSIATSILLQEGYGQFDTLSKVDCFNDQPFRACLS
jgi:hypothetical protein